jgi:hypothetical protein
MSEYGLLTKDIEIDIRILDDLLTDIRYYRELFEIETDDPQRSLMNQENLEFAYNQHNQHIEYLLPRLEEWLKETLKDGERPVRLDYFRILRELRVYSERHL